MEKQTDNIIFNSNIYDFEGAAPPVMTEAMLSLMAKKRQLQRQTAILMIGAFLMMLAISVLAVFFLRFSAPAAIVSFFASAYILVGGGIVSILFFCRGTRLLTEKYQHKKL